MDKKVKVKLVLWKLLLKDKCVTSYVSAYVCVWCRAGIHRNGFSITTSSRSPITDYYHCTMPPNTRPTTPTSSNPLNADDQVRLPPFYFSLEDSLTI